MSLALSRPMRKGLLMSADALPLDDVEQPTTCRVCRSRPAAPANELCRCCLAHALFVARREDAAAS